MFSYDISLDDMDCISYCDNSMYVLPPKTELNSSLFIENEKISQNNRNSLHNSNLSQRKISNNVDIPTYKGFSIAKDYSTNNNKRTHNSILKGDLNNVLPEKCHLSRKVHLSSGKMDAKTEFLMKSFVQTKPKIKHKSDEQLNDTRVDSNRKRNIRRIETFLGDKQYVKRNANVSTKTIVNPTEKSQPNEIDRKQIKEYIENKKRKDIKQANESKLMERQKRDKIEERLKLLSEKTKTNDKIDKLQTRIGKERIKNAMEANMQNAYEALSMKTHCKRAADKSESDSDHSCYAVKEKLAKWSPLSSAEIETYRLASKHYMATAINTNQKTDNILSNIIRISDKMALAKQELLNREIARKKLADWQPLTAVAVAAAAEDCQGYQLGMARRFTSDINAARQSHRVSSSYSFQQERRDTVTESNSVTSGSCEGFAVNDNYTTGLMNDFVNKPERNGVKKDIIPTIIANRARRKLDMDDNKFEKDDCDSSVSAYSDLVDRLIEEKKQRYEKSIEVNEKIVLPPFKSHPKRITNIVKGSIIRQHEIIRTVETDSLTFMKTYLKSKNKTTFDLYNTSTMNTNNSRISNSKSHSHRSMNIEDNGSLRMKGSPTRESMISGRLSNDSQSDKSLSIEKTHESFRESNAFSEVEVTIENSSYNDHVVTQQFHEIPFNPEEYNNFEARLSPNSLAKKFSIELHHYDGIQANMEQLLQSDRFQGIGFAQQETVSLAQILKARQWKDNQETENKQLVQKFLNALSNLNNNQVHKSKGFSSCSSETSNSSTAGTLSPTLPHNKRVNSTTESEASEIEEEIVDFSNSTESQFDNPSNHESSHHLNNKINKPKITNNIQSKEKDKFITAKRNDKKDAQRPLVKIIEQKPIKSVISESIQEVSTARSISQTSSDVSEKFLKEESIAESIETQSVNERSTIDDQSVSSDISKNYNSEILSARTVKTDSNFISSEKSPKEISTTDSIKSEIKSKSVSGNSNKKSNSKSESRSALSTAEESSTIKSENNTTNYSKDDFESNSDRQKSTTSESDVIIRVNLLKNEKQKKQKLLEKLQRKLSVVKQRQKEKNLRNHISYLDSQIGTLQSELNNPNLSSSSLLLSPIAKPHKHISSKEIKVLPTINRKSSTSTSSSSSVTKDEEAKSVTISMSSSTLTSEATKDASFNNKNEFKKPDEIDTPRSSKQIQFEDINEEYSASNRDSSELKTPSEKTHISKEVTDNGTVKSKSENFHILDLDRPKEDEEESIANEDFKIYSARTIHSEISEIPMEDDLSDQEIDNDFFENAEDEEKNKSSCNQDFYSEDFSEVLSQKNSMNINASQSEINEISNNVEIISIVSSDESSETSKSNKSNQSSESIPPIIPLRRRKLHYNNAPDDFAQLEQIPLENSIFTIDKICDELFNTLLTDIIEENRSTSKYQSVSDSTIIGEDEVLTNINKDVSEIIEDPLIEELKDVQYDLLDDLIPWVDENILPLIDVAIEQLFHARQNRTGTLSEAFAHCCKNIPSRFIEKNSSAEKINIYHTWQVNESLASRNLQVKQPYIPKIAVFHLVLEIMERIYELDDQLDPVPWMEDAFNIFKNRKLILWEGTEAPNSIELLRKIVTKQLMSVNILSGAPSKSTNRTRQHRWFHKQTDDIVDRLLIDETLHEDILWQNYDAALETTIFALIDDINDQIVSEIVINIHQ